MPGEIAIFVPFWGVSHPTDGGNDAIATDSGHRVMHWTPAGGSTQGLGLARSLKIGRS
jgi:hypothetical protein